MDVNETPTQHWLTQLLESKSWRNAEVILAVVLILFAFFTRFYDLESRVMSHDESEHTYFSWFLAENGSYQHTPITHGPLQFHLLAITYVIFGDSDASSRFPAAAAGVLAIALILLLRRWLGRTGTLVAMALMIISPYMLFYSRYVRNEALILPVAILMFLAVIRYYETRQDIWLYLLTGQPTTPPARRGPMWASPPSYSPPTGGRRVSRSPWCRVAVNPFLKETFSPLIRALMCR